MSLNNYARVEDFLFIWVLGQVIFLPVSGCWDYRCAAPSLA